MPPKRHAPPSDDERSSSDEEEEEEEDSVTIPGQLSAPGNISSTIIELYRDMKSRHIDLDVEFQRDVVWSRPRQEKLILSLMQHYPIPPLYFSRRTDSKGKDTDATLDGKQRLTSIRKFFDGEIPYIPEGSKTKYFYKEPSFGGKYELMSPAMMKEAEGRRLVCIIYTGLDDIQERAMFQRVQMGMQLSAGERLQSLPGPWPAWIESLVENYVEKGDTLADNLNWKTERGAPFQSITWVVACLGENEQNRAYTALNKFLTSQTDPPSAEFKRKVEGILDKFLEIAKTKELRAPFNWRLPRVAPIEFQMTCMLIQLMRNEPLEDVSHQILQMRTITRKNHADIRSNTRVFNTMWTFCEGVPRARSPSVAADEDTPPPEKKTASSTPKTRSQKQKEPAPRSTRKRRVE